MHRAADAPGAFCACRLNGGLHIQIALGADLPQCEDGETASLLRELVFAEVNEAVIWCRNENAWLRRLIEDTFQVQLSYASREMSLSRAEFAGWKRPDLPAGFALRGHEPALHHSYIRLLGRAMSHLCPPGATPFLDRSEELGARFSKLARENRFHALWFGEALAGVCYSDGGEIDTLALDAAYRGRGAGYALLHTALENAFLYQDQPIRLYVVDQNPNAYAFYSHIGMRVTGHSARYCVTTKT